MGDIICTITFFQLSMFSRSLTKEALINAKLKVLSNSFVIYNTHKPFKFSKQVFIEQHFVSSLVWYLSEVKHSCFVAKLTMKACHSNNYCEFRFKSFLF
jgi:hypothetical protein